MSAHGLAGCRPVAIPDGGKNGLMTLQRFLHSFLSLQVFLSRLSKKIKERQEKTLQDTVSCHTGQEMVKLRIRMDGVLPVVDLPLLFPQDFFQFVDGFRR